LKWKKTSRQEGVILRILGLYAHENLSHMRRVRAPFSVLATRGHSFSFTQTEAFTDGITLSADATVLANWVLSDSELLALRRARTQRAIIVDWSDPDLLEDDLYRAQLSLASLVTVPNDWMRTAIRAINPNVWVTPSCVDMPHFLNANSVKLDPKRPLCIGCLGQYDWYLVKDAIAALLEKHNKLTVIADLRAIKNLPNHPRILGINITCYNISEVLRNTHIGLCPVDGERGYDDIWQYEYGILCRPTLNLSNHKVWAERIEDLLFDDKLRSERGKDAFDEANERRATKLADKYLTVYRKRLPHLALT
jgi:hypothetical protein